MVNTINNKIFKFLPRLGPFCQINYLFEHFSGYPSYPIQKWYIWASFQTSRKRFCKLQEAIWLSVINKIFKVPQRLDPSCPIQKWFIWASFQISKKRFCKLQEALWLRWSYGKKKKRKNFENFKIFKNLFFTHFQLCRLRWATAFSSKHLRKAQILGFKICSINFCIIKMFQKRLRILKCLQLSCYLVSLWCVFFIREKVFCCGLLWNHHHHKHISYIYYTLCSSTDLTLTLEWVLAKSAYRAYLIGMQESHWAYQLYEIIPRQSVLG